MSSGRKVLSFSLVFLLVFMSVLPTGGFMAPLTVKAQEGGVTFFVSPAGSDLNAGTINAPFKSIHTAQEAVRSTILNGMDGDAIVYLRGGEYSLEEKLVFNNQDSGRDGYTVQYLANPGETPIIEGGLSLTNWEAVDDKIYKTNVGNMQFGTLYENDVRSFNARHANRGEVGEGYLLAGSPMTSTPTRSFRFREGDIPLGLVPGAGLEVQTWEGGNNGQINWATSVRAVESIHYVQRIITLVSTVSMNLGPGTRYFIQGSKLLLDAPGEYY